jgi:hypothetical protein
MNTFKIEYLELKKLSKEYKKFLRTNENVGCPMLASALKYYTDGEVVTGFFNQQPHCWVEIGGTRLDLNNLIGSELYLIVSDTEQKGYLRGERGALSFAESLGLTERKFNFWTLKFIKAMTVGG